MKTPRILTIEISPTGKEYTFTVNGYGLKVKISPKNTLGLHPLDILQDDLEDILVFVKRLERFKDVVWDDQTMPLLQSGTPDQKQGIETVEGFINKHNEDPENTPKKPDE